MTHPPGTKSRRNSRSRPLLSLEAPPGFEPGVADLQSDSGTTQRQAKIDLTSSLQTGLHTGCTPSPGLPDDLLGIVNAWPRLPQHVRRAIMTLADSCQ